MPKFYWLVILIVIISVNFSFAQPKSKKSSSIKPLRVYISGIEMGKNLEDLNPSSVEAAFAFSMMLTNFFDIIPQKYVDSTRIQWKREGKTFTIVDLANHFQADFLVYINLNRFKNMLRCDITLLFDKNFQKKSNGSGFSFINYQDTVSKNYLYDPSILTALQRAFAVAVKDSNLYANTKNPVIPIPSLVITGIEFRKKDELPSWSLFTNSVINSYFMVEKIFDIIAPSNKYQPFDIETRDSIYATFNFFAPENYKAPNQMELYALRQFEIETIITGAFEQKVEGGELVLILAKFTNVGLTEINRVKGLVTSDSILEFEKVISELTNQLIGKEILTED